MLTTILIFLLILSLLVFVHELGHFLVARKMGMKVEEFGFGFPPRAFSIIRGETVYSINWIPIGGFVRLKGENGQERKDPDSFASKKPWQRFLVLVAGVAMNFLTAAVILSLGFALGSPSALDSNLPAGASVREISLRAASVAVESPAARAGIVPGEILVSLNGQTFTDGETVRTYIRAQGDAGIDALVRSEKGEERHVALKAEDLKTVPGVHGVGVGIMATGIVSLPWYRAVPQGFVAAAGMTRDVVVGLGGIIKSLVTEGKAGAELSGPVGIAVMTGDVAKLGFLYLLPFIAMLSVNLAVVNLLPFPALDGGRIAFLLVEKLRRKPNDEKVEAVVNNIGFLVLIGLIFLVTIRDFLQLKG